MGGVFIEFKGKLNICKRFNYIVLFCVNFNGIRNILQYN